jgi:RES domain-containing protein
MRLWRISDFPDLRGYGGLLTSGRWHTRGRQIVYLSDHPASALLEVLVHLEVDVEELPTTYQLLAIDISDEVAGHTGLIDQFLPMNWRENLASTRKLGDEWLISGNANMVSPRKRKLDTANGVLKAAHCFKTERVAAFPDYGSDRLRQCGHHNVRWPSCRSIHHSRA